MLKKYIKTLLSFILTLVYLVSACGSIEGPEIWIYATVIFLALVSYAILSYMYDKKGK